MNRRWDAVRDYLRSAPLTYAWLAALLATTLVQHQLTARTLRRLLQSTSTNIHHLASDPLRVLFQSLLWIDGRYWWPYLLVYTIFLAPAERWLGHLRWAVVGLVCHLGATYLGEGYLYWSIHQAAASSRLIDARDVGVSYFVVGIVGVLFYRIPRRWRWGYLAVAILILGGALALHTNFTSVGHLCALFLGLACYPLTRGKPTSAAAYTPAVAISDDDLKHLRRCVALAREAQEAGDEPFGSLLVDAAGEVRVEERNRVNEGPIGGDATRHPEFEIARWSTSHLTPDERAGSTVYTSGEHCPMCAAAHAWVGLGRIVYAASSAQLVGWLQVWGVSAAPVVSLPISTIAPSVDVDGPAPEFAEEMKAMFEATYRR